MRSSSSSRSPNLLIWSPKVGMLTFDWKSKLCSSSSWFRWHIWFLTLRRFSWSLSRFSGNRRKNAPKTDTLKSNTIKNNPVLDLAVFFVFVGNFSSGSVWCSVANEGHTWYEVHLKMKWQGIFSGNAASNSNLTWRTFRSQTNLKEKIDPYNY